MKNATLDSPEVLNIHPIYNNGELAFFDNLENINTSSPFKIEAFAVVLVLKGRASVIINGSQYEAGANDMFICPPNNIIENGLLSLDFKCLVIYMTPRYINKIMPLSENLWDVKFFFEEHPLCSLQPEEAEVFCQYYKLLCSKMQTSSPVQEKVINTLMLAFIYDMQYILGRVIKPSPRPFASGESLFKRFIGLIEASQVKYQGVAFYAAKLCVTPKYLSAICKQISGMTASCLIDKYVMKDIEYMMTHTNKSIKEIAADLNFSNLSFFGKYMRKHFGLSPRAFRAQALKKA